MIVKQCTIILVSIYLYFIMFHLIIKEAKQIKTTFFTFRHTVFYKSFLGTT